MASLIDIADSMYGTSSKPVDTKGAQPDSGNSLVAIADSMYGRQEKKPSPKTTPKNSGTYNKGQSVLGYAVTGDTKFHGGTPGVFDISGNSIKGHQESLDAAAEKFRQAGYAVYVHYKAGTDELGHHATAPSLHVVDPRVAPKDGKYGWGWIDKANLKRGHPTTNMVKSKQAQKDWKPISRHDIDALSAKETLSTIATESPRWALNSLKSAGEVISGVAQFGARSLATLGAGAEPGIVSPERRATAAAASTPPKSAAGRWLAEATTPFSREEVAEMLPSPSGIYKGLATGDMAKARQSLGSIVNNFYEGYATAPEQLKTGEIAPLLNSVLMTVGAVKGGFDITKRLRSPKAGRLVKVAVDETRAGNTQKALPAWEDVIDMVETQEKGRIVWKDPQDRASVINALASPVKAELPKVRANTALPEPRPASPGEPIVTTPPEGSVPSVIDRGYTAPSPGAMPIPFQRIPELAKGTRVQFAQPAGMKEAGEFVVKAADRKTVTLRNANTGVSLKTTPAKLKVAAEQTAAGKQASMTGVDDSFDAFNLVEEKAKGSKYEAPKVEPKQETMFDDTPAVQEPAKPVRRYPEVDKQKQFDIVSKANPMQDDIHTGIRSVDGESKNLPIPAKPTSEPMGVNEADSPQSGAVKSASDFSKQWQSTGRYSAGEASAMTALAEANRSYLGMSEADYYPKLWKGITGVGKPAEGALAQKYDPSLIAIHNTTADGVNAADALGGIPAPSLAITHPDIATDSYGEVSLVGTRDMVDPEKRSSSKVFESDAYSARQPLARWKIDNAAVKRFVERINKTNAAQDIAGYKLYNLADYGDSYNGENAKGKWIDESLNDYSTQGLVMRLAFLREKGIAIDNPTPGAKEGVGSFARKDAFRKNVLPNFWKPEYDAEFEALVREAAGQMFVEPHLLKGRSKVPYTLENVVAVMTKSGVQAKENTMFYGLGKSRASASKALKSVDAMHKKEGNLVSRDEFEAAKKEVSEKFNEFSDSVHAYYRWQNSPFGWLDDASKALGDYAKGAETLDSMRAALRRNDFDVEFMHDDILRQGMEVSKALMSSPTEYFEAKLRRAVPLSDFAGAVVPADARPELIDTLTRNGITRIVKYDAAVKGDRQAKISEFSDLLFQKQGGDIKGTTEFTESGQAIIRAFESADISTGIHEMAHVFRRNLKDHDLAILEDAYGVKDGAWTYAHEEQFARGFERYLREGKAPTAGLRKIFTQFKEWLTNIYQRIKGSPIEKRIPEQVREVYDRMLGRDVELTGKAKSASESGKANIGTLMKVAGYGASAVTLYTLAQKLRNDPDAREKALETKARQFGEGGFMSHAFDAMASMSYLSTAIEMEIALPGKQGVGKLFKNRAQWSDVSALGVLPDIAFDPLNFVSPAKIAGVALKPLKYAAVKSGLAATFEAAAKTIAETASMRKALDFFEFELLGGMGSIRTATVNARKYLDKKMDAFISNHAVWMEEVEPLRKHIVELGKKLGPDFDKDVARVVDEGWEISARGTELSFEEARRAVHNQKVQLLRTLAKEKGLEYAKAVREAAEQVMELENKASDLLVDAGQLSREVADKWNNVHLRRMYERFEDVDNYLDALSKSDPVKARKLRSSWEMFKKTYKLNSNRLDLSATKMRKELPEEIMNILKEVPYASVRLLKGQSVAADLAYKAKMYSEIASEVALTEEQVAKLGGKVKDYMFLDPDEVLSIGKEMGKIPASKYFGNLAGKWIPQAMFYDLMSSLPTDKSAVAKFAAKTTTLWKLGKVPLSIVTGMRNFYTNIILADVLGKTSPYRVDLYYKALRSLATKDDTYKEAKAAGTFLTDTFTHSELENAMREATQDPYSKMERLRNAVRWIAEKPSQAYNANEQWFKMTVYHAAKERGLNPEKAADFADRALFNYRKVPKGIDTMRRHGFMPFIVFPFKAIPATFKAFWTDTGRLSKYAKVANAIDQRTPEDVKRRERAVMPPWMLDAVRLPGKDARYFDVEYLLPYGGVNDYFDAKWVNNINPAVGTVSDILHDQNMFTGAQITDEGLPKAERTKQYVEYALKAALPSMTPGVGSVSSALEKLREPEQTEYLNKKQIAYLLGLKTTLLDTDKSASMLVWQLDRAEQQMTSGIRKIVKRNGIKQFGTIDDLKSKLSAKDARLVDAYIGEFEKKAKAIQKKLEVYNSK